MEGSKPDLRHASKAHYSGHRIQSALRHFLLGRGASAIVSLGTLLLLLRGLPVQDYGVYVTLMALQGVLLLVSALGLDATIDRFMPELRLTHSASSLQKAVFAALGIRVLILALVLASLAWSGEWFARVSGMSSWTIYAPWLLALIFLNGLFNLTGNILDTLLLQKWSQISGFMNVLSRLGILFGVYWSASLSVQTVLYAEIASSLLGLMISLYALLRYFPGRFSDMRQARLFDETLTRRLFRFASLNFGARLLNQTQGPHGLRLVVSHFHGIGAAATFGFVMSLADLLERYLPTVLLTRLIRPVFVSRYTANRDFSQINEFASLLIKINLLVVAPAVMLSAFHGDHIVRWIAGDKYADTQWALVMALALLIPNSHKVVIALVANTLEKNAMQFTGGIFAVLGLGLGIALSFQWGLYGVLAGALTAATLYNLYAVVYLRHQGYPYTPDEMAAVKIIVSSAMAVAGTWIIAWGMPGPTGVLLAMLAALVVFWPMLRWLGVFNTKDRALLAQVLPTKTHRLLKFL